MEHVFQLTEVELSLTSTILTEECIRCGAVDVELSGYDEPGPYTDEASPQ